MARRTPTDRNTAPPPPSTTDTPAPRRPRAKRETSELPVMTRAQTQGFWNQRQLRPSSESIAVIATPPSKPATKTQRAPTARARRPSSSGGSDDFLEEVPTNVVTEE